MVTLLMLFITLSIKLRLLFRYISHKMPYGNEISDNDRKTSDVFQNTSVTFQIVVVIITTANDWKQLEAFRLQRGYNRKTSEAFRKTSVAFG